MIETILTGCGMMAEAGNSDNLSFDQGRAFVEVLAGYDEKNMQKADWANGGFFGCDFSENNVRFVDGIMKLFLTGPAPGAKYLYSGAEYRSREKFGYGLYMVRMKPVKNVGVVSSFFTFTREDDGSNWDEIDIEFLGKDTSRVQFNFYSDGVGHHELLYNLGFDASDEFHDYGFLWTRDAIIWYVDSLPIYAVNSLEYNIPDSPGKIMMNVWNGNNTDKTLSWLGEYDGKGNLYAEYESFTYLPLAEY